MYHRVLLWLWLCALAWATTEDDLVSAVQSGNVSEVQVLVGQFDISSISRRVSYYGQDHRSWTLLHDAARYGHSQVLQLLLETWPDGIDSTSDVKAQCPQHSDSRAPCRGGSTSWTPLHVAAMSGQVEAFSMLVEALSQKGRTASLEDLMVFQSVDCNLLVGFGCDPQGIEVLDEAARDLDCRNPYELTNRSLEMWLYSCKGDIRWHDDAGTPLLDLLENEDARKFWREHATLQASMLNTMRDWQAWVIPGLAALMAYLSVLVERKFLHWCCEKSRTQQAQTDNDQDPFLSGAKLLVSRAFSRFTLSVKMWRWLEVSVGIFWLGLVLLIAHWAWWLPLVAVLYVAPAIKLHGARELFQSPTLALVSRSFGGKVAALIRTTALFGIFCFLYGGLYWKMVIPESVISAFSWMLDPSVVAWEDRKVRLLRNSKLNEHWLFPWAPPITALEIFRTVRDVCIGLVVVYWVILLCMVLFKCFRRCLCRSITSPTPSRHELEDAVRQVLQKPPDEFGEVHKGIKPTTSCSLYKSVAMQLLDIAFDFNTVLSFLLDRNYLFAAVMTFFVVRSITKQFYVLPFCHFREALRESVRRGIPRQDVLDFLEEEKRSEALFCACITAYALFFSVNTAGQMLTQYCSLVSSTWQLRGHAAELCNMDFPVDEAAGVASASAAPLHEMNSDLKNVEGKDASCQSANEENPVSAANKSERDGATAVSKHWVTISHEFIPQKTGVEETIDTSLRFDHVLTAMAIYVEDGSSYNGLSDAFRRRLQKQEATEILRRTDGTTQRIWAKEGRPSYQAKPDPGKRLLDEAAVEVAKQKEFLPAFSVRILAALSGSTSDLTIDESTEFAKQVTFEGFRGRDTVGSLKDRLLKDGLASRSPRIFLPPHELRDATKLGECFAQWSGFGLDAASARASPAA
ncbi:unnamed protein product [Symbiodinium sp. CCMP2456]|nr:unnamed protein product [Symbiodinium sp. CCMP2456]